MNPDDSDSDGPSDTESAESVEHASGSGGANPKTPEDAAPKEKWDAGSPGIPSDKTVDQYLAYMYAQIQKALAPK